MTVQYEQKIDPGGLIHNWINLTFHNPFSCFDAALHNLVYYLVSNRIDIYSYHDLYPLIKELFIDFERVIRDQFSSYPENSKVSYSYNYHLEREFFLIEEKEPRYITILSPTEVNSPWWNYFAGYNMLLLYSYEKNDELYYVVYAPFSMDGKQIALTQIVPQSHCGKPHALR